MSQLCLLDHTGHLPATRPGPIVKWAGGKTRLLPQLLPMLPPGVNQMRHVEPFAGGAAMFFARRPARALLCDTNQDLIATYTAVRDNVNAVIQQLRKLSARHCSEHYYRMRERFNRREACPAAHAALFIYLNKTCFNGLYRVNGQGQFNVPAGKYVNPCILDEAALRTAAVELSGAELRRQSFEQIVEQATSVDYLYFDPPYEPVSDTANFTSYAQDGFCRDDQARLREVFGELDKRGCKLMLSNSDMPLIRELYASYRIDAVQAQRSISCKGAKRGSVQELVVRNY